MGHRGKWVTVQNSMGVKYTMTYELKSDGTVTITNEQNYSSQLSGSSKDLVYTITYEGLYSCNKGKLEIVYDMAGQQKGEIPYTGLYAFPADEKLREAAMSAAREAGPYIQVLEGRVCSGDQFISTKEQRDEITSSFGGLCCEMEGAAIAQTCYLNDVPFVVIRAISDKPDETQVEEYHEFESKAAMLCAALVEYMVEFI